jgi:hypothetical protein
MNNKYIYYTDIDFDLEKLQDIVVRNIEDYRPDLAAHQHYVSDEPYLVELQKKYPFFSSVYNIYTAKPNSKSRIHIDAKRQCAVNIPIFYTEGSYTRFHEILDGAKLTYFEENIYNAIKEEDSFEVYRFTLDRPTLINTKLPHDVIGGPVGTRIILSWSINPEFDYETIKSRLMSMS